MSKAILVIDVDDEYLDKEISIIKFTNGNAIYCSEILKPLPSRTTKEYWTCEDGTDRYDAKWRKCEARGYNACIDEILGKDND